MRVGGLFHDGFPRVSGDEPWRPDLRVVPVVVFPA